jgi:hypothetical protein
VHVVPELSVGVGLVQGGVRGDVDLIAASVPASAGAKLIGDPTHLDDVVFKIDMGADLVVDALDGKLSVFLEACFLGCTDIASKEIYNWKGYHWEIPIFKFEKDLRFQVFDAATSPTGVPGGGSTLPVFETASLGMAP